MNEVKRVIGLLQHKARLVAMLAPSFPIVYPYPQIISRLKRLGFVHVVEVAAGAKKTNQAVVKLLQTNPRARFITSPCPTLVRLVRKKHPDLLPYLALAADSPMVATAKIVQKKYPDCQPVFIGPCLVKKLEATEDYPKLDILVLTYQELETIFNTCQIGEVSPQADDRFDIAEKVTRLYPIDGGLTESSGLKNILRDEEIRIVSGWNECEAALSEFTTNTTIRLLDILFCEGGCINGPGIKSNLSRQEREAKIVQYALK